MTEWKTYRLGDIASFSQGIQVDIDKQLPYKKGGYVRFIRIVDFTKANEPYRYIETPKKQYLTNSGDIVMIRYGSQTAGLVVKSFEGAIANNMFKITLDEQVVDRDFIYYALSQEDIFSSLRNAQSSSTMPAITFEIASRIQLKIPSLEEQRRIAGILGAIDDKIENNRRINDNLEQQAQALFKSWFVDFEPFKDGEFVDSELGMIPKGWRVGSIGDYCKIRSGYAFKSSWWTDKGVKIIKIKNITENGNLDMSDCSHVLSKNCTKAYEFRAEAGDLIIAMTGATIGKFCIIPEHSEEYYINQRVGKFFLGNAPMVKLPFIHCLLNLDRVSTDIINRGQGSAQPNISALDVESIKIVMPRNDIIERFNKLLQFNYILRLTNIAEINNLISLRDTLLPKLMNGDIKM